MRLSEVRPQLTYPELAEEITKYGYREEWKLSVFNDAYEGPCLFVRAIVPDARRPGKKVVLRIRSNIPPLETTEDFGRWLLWRLGQIELHECRELLHYGGQLLVDPHDPIEPD